MRVVLDTSVLEVESSGVEMRQAARLISVGEFNGTIFPST
jgi:hypothetical protein